MKILYSQKVWNSDTTKCWVSSCKMFFLTFTGAAFSCSLSVDLCPTTMTKWATNGHEIASKSCVQYLWAVIPKCLMQYSCLIPWIKDEDQHFNQIVTVQRQYYKNCISVRLLLNLAVCWQCALWINGDPLSVAAVAVSFHFIFPSRTVVGISFLVLTEGYQTNQSNMLHTTSCKRKKCFWD